MSNLSFAAHQGQRSFDSTQSVSADSDLLTRTLERLNESLASSLAATGKVRDHGRLAD